MVCSNIRRKRHALPEPAFPGSLYMSVYRPNLEDDRFISDGISEGNRWNFGGARDRFQKVGMLRVSKILFYVNIFQEKKPKSPKDRHKNLYLMPLSLQNLNNFQ